MSEHRSLLGEISYSLLGTLEHRQSRDLFIIKEDPSGIRSDESCDHVEARGLSCTVRTEESHDLSLLDFHRNTLHDRPWSIFLYQIFTT